MASDDDAHTALLLGAIETGKSRVAGQGTSLVSHSLAVVGTSLVASSVNGAQVSLWRWEEPPRTEGAAPFATFDGTLEHTVVAHGEPPMVFRVTQDGLLVQVALVNCVQL
jgi:hypothetical protein